MQQSQMKRKQLTSADKASYLGRANDSLKRSKQALLKAGDFAMYSIDKDIIEAYGKIELFITNACNNLEKF